MKVIYRGHEISVERAGRRETTGTLWFSVFRVADGYECVSGIEDSAETCRTMSENLKERVDRELACTDPWGEHAKNDDGVWLEDLSGGEEPDERLREID